jgi:multicomponent K+:H+ antiporter subunit G
MSALPVWLDALVATLLVLGAAFALVGSWGLFKLGDFLKRLHGPTKATTLGVGLVLVASLLWFGAQGLTTGRELLVTLFVFLTAPVSAHLLVKAAIRHDRANAPPPAPER